MRIDQVFELLTDAGVALLDPKSRQKLAERAVNTHNLTTDQIETLCCYAEATRGMTRAGGFIAKALGLDDPQPVLRAAVKHRKQRDKEPGRGISKQNTDREFSSLVNQEHQAMHAYNITAGGRTGPHAAAKQMSITTERLAQLVELGASLYGSPNAKLAAAAIMDGRAGDYVSWLILQKRGALQRESSQKRVTALAQRYAALIPAPDA